jgi:hypothetical protein
MSALVTDYLKRILFRVRWFFWSERERYAYLWNRTQHSL